MRPLIINIKDKVWQTVFVTDILQACLRQMSAISFNCCMRKGGKETETFLHATKEIGDVNPGYLGSMAMVGKIQPDKRQHTNYLYFIF